MSDRLDTLIAMLGAGDLTAKEQCELHEMLDAVVNPAPPTSGPLMKCVCGDPKDGGGCTNKCDRGQIPPLPAATYRVTDSKLQQVPTPADESGAEGLWCLHMQGPDEVHAAPSKESAEAAAENVNRYFDRHAVKPNAVASPWPHSTESHAESLKEWSDWAAPQERNCHVCGGDCGSANPPVMNCPMQTATKPAPANESGADGRACKVAGPCVPGLVGPCACIETAGGRCVTQPRTAAQEGDVEAICFLLEQAAEIPWDLRREPMPKDEANAMRQAAGLIRRLTQPAVDLEDAACVIRLGLNDWNPYELLDIARLHVPAKDPGDALLLDRIHECLRQQRFTQSAGAARRARGDSDV